MVREEILKKFDHWPIIIEDPFDKTINPARTLKSKRDENEFFNALKMTLECLQTKGVIPESPEMVDGYGKKGPKCDQGKHFVEKIG